VVKSSNGNIVRLSDIATVEQSTRNSRSAAWFNREPSVLLIITKQGDANVIETVDNIRALIPEIKRGFPPTSMSRSCRPHRTIRASVGDMQLTLLGTIGMVMLVVFVFLRRATPTIAAGITVPLSLAGTCALMWCVGFSIDNLSLMALAVSVGFVVDDAIVMIENVFRNMEKGHSPLRATIEGRRQIGFTVISISISLVAAFIPLLFMGGIVGRAFREFSVTLAFAILVSTIVSLTVTPMICAHYVRSVPSRPRRASTASSNGCCRACTAAYGASLQVLLEHRVLMMVVFAATIALTVDLYIKTPKGFFPQDDTGLIFTSTRASPDISYKAMVDMQLKALDIVLADPAVAASAPRSAARPGARRSTRAACSSSLKPLAERDNLPTNRVIDRLRPQFARIPGIEVYMFPAQDVRVGGARAARNISSRCGAPISTNC
jgi:multidrug efflux pump